MEDKKKFRPVISFILLFIFLVGCANSPNKTAPTSPPVPGGPVETPSLAHSPTPSPTQPPDISAYRFPDSIDPTKRYLFYIHGKIIEDQGLPAVSPDFGEYQYLEILETLSGYGFVVISEQRPKDADGVLYAREINRQVRALIKAGVPAKNITVVGASKGAAITIYASYFLENEAINYVLLAICHPDVVEQIIQNQVNLFGNVLSVYDSIDTYAGPCQPLFTYSEGKGLSSHDEIVLDMELGHGLLYRPYDEWIASTVQWASKHSPLGSE